MRRVILAGAILASVIGVPLAIAIPSASAQSSFPSNVCIIVNGNPGQCMNDWNGNLQVPDQAVSFFHYGNSGGNNRIDVEFVNYINQVPGGFQPFDNGSDLNAIYNGRPVYRLEWYRNGKDTGICIAGLAYNANSYNENCNISSGQDELWYVWTKFSGLVAVGSSNLRFSINGQANAPVWMGSNGKGNTGDGKNVYLTTTQDDNLPWGFFEDGG